MEFVLFLLGLVLGIMVAMLIVTTLAFFRLGTERKIQIIQRRLEDAGPKPTGAVFLPEDDADIARREKIVENSQNGKDTPISELL